MCLGIYARNRDSIIVGNGTAVVFCCSFLCGCRFFFIFPFYINFFSAFSLARGLSEVSMNSIARDILSNEITLQIDKFLMITNSMAIRLLIRCKC